MIDMSFTESMISECIEVLNEIEIKDVDTIADILDTVRTNKDCRHSGQRRGFYEKRRGRSTCNTNG